MESSLQNMERNMKYSNPKSSTIHFQFSLSIVFYHVHRFGICLGTQSAISLTNSMVNSPSADHLRGLDAPNPIGLVASKIEGRIWNSFPLHYIR